ncbi:site-specific DNA-methyltransferase, partial [Salmonella enterica]|nr:site-specific DNA-methyltransferase [Salmonella enterica]
NRNLPYWGTNFGTEAIAFQRWRHFKEAYAPEIVKRALSESEIPVKNCLDPFGGSGTTALACQFLGVVPTTIEVNPYLSDLIKAKLEFYDFSTLSKDLGAVIKRSYSITINIDIIRESLPPTFIEPGVKGRWIFDIECAIRIFKILAAINELDNSKNKNLFKVLLGGILIDISNVKIDGKGRRYKNNWINNRVDPVKVDK